MELSKEIEAVRSHVEAIQKVAASLEGRLERAKGAWPDHQIAAAEWRDRSETPPVGQIWASDGLRVWLIHSDGTPIGQYATAVKYWTTAYIPAPPDSAGKLEPVVSLPPGGPTAEELLGAHTLHELTGQVGRLLHAWREGIVPAYMPAESQPNPADKAEPPPVSAPTHDELLHLFREHWRMAVDARRAADEDIDPDSAGVRAVVESVRAEKDAERSRLLALQRRLFDVEKRALEAELREVKTRLTQIDSACIAAGVRSSEPADSVLSLVRERNDAEARAGRLGAELEVTGRLLAERDLLLADIPECDDHGKQCVPHARLWVEGQKALGARLVAQARAFEAWGHEADVVNLEGRDKIFYERGYRDAMGECARRLCELAEGKGEAVPGVVPKAEGS